MTGDPLATVIIVNYNGAHLLPACLDALDAQRTDAVAFDTVVVDNASSDESLQLLADKYPWVQVIASARQYRLRRREQPGVAAVVDQVRRPAEQRRHARARLAGQPPGAVRSGDEPRSQRSAGKVVFMPRFVRLAFATDGFRPGPHDRRDLGMRIHRLSADGADVSAKVLWESAAYGLERVGGQEYFCWTRPDGEILIPVPIQRAPGGVLDAPLTITLTIAAETTKPVLVNGVRSTVAQTPSEIESCSRSARLPRWMSSTMPAASCCATAGTAPTAASSRSTAASSPRPRRSSPPAATGWRSGPTLGTAVGWFDDDFFMYYEDTDLSWRIRSRGYTIRYQPDAVLRHIHAASSKEWSPLWVYHVDRNRLLMLTKDASARMAVGAVVRYPLVAISMALRVLVEMLRTRKRPALGPHVLRARVFAAYLRLLPRMLRQRIAIGHAARVSRSELESWLTQR